mmetsp:Transcript_61101/g.164212  ORF Transcript_61101/g.164212 Transcript_61101/m.164212 type:complete len:169 (+) Transcript_61101:137-643(+)
MILGREYACCVVLLVATVACNAQKQNYTIGAWIPGTQDEMLAKVRPIFEEYLNQKVGPQTNPPVSFKVVPVDYSKDQDSYVMIGNGELDFLYSVPGKISCAVVEHGWAVISARRVRVNGKDTGADGSVVYSLKKNTAIQNVTDFENKRIGMGSILDVATYQSGYQVSN